MARGEFMSNFIVEFPLVVEQYQQHILDKRYEIGRKIYNSLIDVTQKRYKEMVKTKRYRNYKSRLAELGGSTAKDAVKERKEIYKKLSELSKEFGMSEYSFYKDVKFIRRPFKKNIDSYTARKLAKSLWQSYEALLFGNGTKVHYKRYGELNSLEGETDKAGMRFLKGNQTLVWNKLAILVQIDNKKKYEIDALENDISYCRIVRKYIRSKSKYYLQITFKGKPPIKYNRKTGEIKNSIGYGDVGLDIGTQTIAISSMGDVKLFELADKVQNIENEKRRIQRKLDRSRRATNPRNFNADGTIKKQGNKKVFWIKSNHYKKDVLKLKELYRKQTAMRKYQHECLANYIINLGDKVYVETMNFSGLQKRAKKTEKKDKGKLKRKKRFGKSIANKAPAMLIEIVNRKLKKHDKEIIKIDTWNAKASQFNHMDETYKKKKLSQRWATLDDGIKVQRDMYSAFLIMNIKDDLKTFNQNKCNERFDKFMQMHDLEVARLKGNKNLSSIEI